ncbi:hypothetical protein GF336_02530 [Candidatus Woesearchaeota archaeon]|nr:hypothetical protein [Candidatus Woesearchaeota archaeon]
MRAIKKIMALTTGATMLGATLMGAMAADLADYPSPLFIEDNAFNGAIVVGDDAKSEDVVGAIDIATSLQYVTAAAADGTTGDSVTVEGGEAWMIDSATRLQMGTDLGTVKAIIDDDELPTILAEGKYRNGEGTDTDYKQKLEFNSAANAVELGFKADSDYNDKDPSVMIYGQKNNRFLTYTLSFTGTADSDNASGTLEDFEDTSLTMLGKTYEIVNAAVDSSAKITLDLMGGAIRDVMEQGQIKTFTLNDKDYEVEVTYIGGTSTSQVKFKVNGETTDALETGNTHKLDDGTEIGVREILEEEAGEVTADQVEFYLGAQKISFIDSDISDEASGSANEYLQVGGDDSDHLKIDVYATSTGSEVKLSKLEMEWYPDDDIFVTEDNSVTFPDLNSFKISSEGLYKAEEETISLETDGDKQINLVVPVESGEAEIPLFGLDSGKAYLSQIGGDESDELLKTTEGLALTFNLTTDQQFVLTDTSEKASYVMEIDQVKNDSGTMYTTFQDVVSGSEWKLEQGVPDDVAGVQMNVTTSTESADGYAEFRITGTNGNMSKLYTPEGLTIYLPVQDAATGANSTASNKVNLTSNSVVKANVFFKEENKDETIETGTSFSAQVGITSSKIEVKSLSDGTDNVTSKLYGAALKEDQDDDKVYEGHVESALASYVNYDQDATPYELEINYFGEEVYGRAYIAELETTFGEVSGVSSVTSPVKIPSAKLASEITDVTAQNMLLVGGPCANAATAEAFGLESSVPGCLEGFEEGKAMIKVEEMSSGKVAMLVAGYSAMDTRRATRVVANYDDYALSGDEVEVTGTSLSDISVSAPSAADDAEE